MDLFVKTMSKVNQLSTMTMSPIQAAIAIRHYASFGKSTKPLSSRQFIPDCNVLPSDSRQNVYKAQVLKRMKKHGLTTRLQTVSGKRMLWRKLLKGSHEFIKMHVAP